METAKTIQTALAHAYGTDGYTRWNPVLFRNHCMTDGVEMLAEMAECYWLLDAIASYHADAMQDPMLRDIQFWKLQLNGNGGAVLTCERDEGNIAFTQTFEHTDFPLDEIKIWVTPMDETRYVLMLPSEY